MSQSALRLARREIVFHSAGDTLMASASVLQNARGANRPDAAFTIEKSKYALHLAAASR